MDKNQINLNNENDVQLTEKHSIDAQLTILADIIANLLLKEVTEEGHFRRSCEYIREKPPIP